MVLIITLITKTMKLKTSNYLDIPFLVFIMVVFVCSTLSLIGGGIYILLKAKGWI